MPTNDEMRRLCPDVPDMDDLFQTPKHAISRTCDTMNIITPSGKSLSYKFEGLILNRVAHDEALVTLAKDCGAEYLVNSYVESVEKNTVKIRNGYTYTAKVIVGAGGHNDPIRRKYWQEKSVNIPVKFELKDGDYGEAVELHFGSMAPGGYAWMFPKSEGANIGLGIQKSFANGKSLNKYSSEFIDKYTGDTTFKGAGSLPMSGTIKRFVKDNYVLVGDAAGMVLPSNGAGITIAMVGGRIAGQTNRRAYLNGTSIDDYEKIWQQANGSSNEELKAFFQDWQPNV